MLTLNVVASNQGAPPAFTAGANVTVAEDSGSYAQAWATQITNSQGGAGTTNLQFIVTNDNAALFSAAPTVAADGQLKFTAAQDANGSANVSVTLRDNSQAAGSGSDVSATTQFTVRITPVNDTPTFVPGNSLTLSQGYLHT
jgi:hypothetical protein